LSSWKVVMLLGEGRVVVVGVLITQYAPKPRRYSSQCSNSKHRTILQP